MQKVKQLFTSLFHPVKRFFGTGTLAIASTAYIRPGISLEIDDEYFIVLSVIDGMNLKIAKSRSFFGLKKRFVLLIVRGFQWCKFQCARLHYLCKEQLIKLLERLGQ